MQPIKKGLYQLWLAAGANRKIAPTISFFENHFIYATPMVYLFHQLFYFLFLLFRPPEKVSFN